MPKQLHSKQRARIDMKKEKGRAEKADNDNRAVRNHERAIMHMLVRRKYPKHGGLEPARVHDLGKALETPDPLPRTPEDIEADLQRRDAAMVEINAAIDRLPDQYKRDLEILRARKPQMARSRVGNIPPSVTPNVDKDLLSPRILRPRRLSKKETKIKKRKPESVEDDGPQYGEPDIVSKEEWEEQEWNKTRELREEQQRKDNEAEEARSMQEHEAFMKEIRADVEEAERF